MPTKKKLLVVIQDIEVIELSYQKIFKTDKKSFRLYIEIYSMSTVKYTV